MTDIMNFITSAFTRHVNDLHGADFQVCPDDVCRRARQLEVWLILTRQWTGAAWEWLIGRRG